MTIDQSARATTTGAQGLRGGERVRLRPWDQIQASLDTDGCTDKLPFMAEMLALHGRTMTVESRADKTCDTINLQGCTREMDDTVHLANMRCDGSAHGGCQAHCLFYFREQWLERVPDDKSALLGAVGEPPPEDLAETLDRFANPSPNYYRCQATQALEASRPLRGIGHYWDTLRTRNVPISRVMQWLFWAIVNLYQKFSRHFVPRALRYQQGATLPYLWGPVTDENWPQEPPLNLQPGELVEVRSQEEIRATLDRFQRNRGLWFDQEMATHCGKRGRILHRVERLIDEKTGKMLRVKKDLYIVSGLVGCEGVFHKLCTRAVMGMFRDVWLRRVE
jgi:hypothetical protein